MVKSPPAIWETWVWFLGGKDPLRRDAHSSTLVGEFCGHWWTLVGYSPWRCKERGMNEQLSLSLFQEQEQGLPRHLAHSTTKGWADPLSRPSGPTIGLATPYKSPYIRSQLVPPQKVNTGNGSCFCFLILWEESQWNLAWISCLVFYQFLLTEEANFWPVLVSNQNYTENKRNSLDSLTWFLKWKAK